MHSNYKRAVVLTVVGISLLVVSVTILNSYYFGHGRAGRVLSSASLPPGLSAAPSSTLSSTSAPSASATAVPVKTGIPVRVIAPDHRVQAKVSANRMNPDGSLYVPPDPRAISWASQQVPPGSPHGTTILVGHINSNGVSGVFADLADYRVGQVITLELADGRKMKYAVVAEPMEVDKDNVSRRRQELFDQSHAYGLVGRPKSGRLLLLSCGGEFDNRTGHYESNIFVYAFPV